MLSELALAHNGQARRTNEGGDLNLEVLESRFANCSVGHSVRGMHGVSLYRQPKLVFANPHDHSATNQPDCHYWSVGLLYGGGHGHGSFDLSVAEEWFPYKRCVVPQLYDAGYDGLRQRITVHRGD